MKSILLTLACVLAISACDRKPTPSETVKDKINDALDRRPAEGVRDAVEDVGDAVEDVGDALKDAGDDASKNLKEVTR